nr:uncharacterized protein LOC126529858 [Dermacentor andersoni]
MKLPSDCTPLPVSTIEELLAFDNYLSDRDHMDLVCNFFLFMYCMSCCRLAISLKGGSNAKDGVRRVLRQIVSKTVSLQCSWAGPSGKKIPFKSLTNVLHLLLGATRALFGTTDTAVPDTTEWWLMFAVDQEGGRTHRRRVALLRQSDTSQDSTS